MYKLIATVTAVLALSGFSSAQEWPTRPVTLVVPYGAGSPADLLGQPHIREAYLGLE